MADRTSDDNYDVRSVSSREGTYLFFQQNRQSEALRDFLGEWAEEAGPPDAEDVAAMRRLYFPQ